MQIERELFEIPSQDGPLIASLSDTPEVIRKNRIPLIILATGDGPSGSKGQTWTQLLPMIKNAGMASLLFDFRGLGYSDGTYEDLTLSMGCRNLEAILKYVTSSNLQGDKGVGILGSSFGGNVALLTAGKYTEVGAIALKSPSSFLPEGYQLQYGAKLMKIWSDEGYHPEVGLKYTAVIDSLMHNTFLEASKISVPVRIVQGDADTAVPIRHSRDLVQVMKKASLLELPGVDHWYAETGAWDAMSNDLISFLKENL
ncbi:prolyl oligopeptidase family serine peptidase [Actinomyces bowdenii]|uniref:alpha/beta hydrolase family protein n=1 Tax=Actinomyces bowdenii TaxID=131109 RepID=UPI001ABC80F3|nr:alpha/beta fold hydrolase [Actinomyces bowdenii]MBO3724177.1 prolyl oligopeptidase family serine peptidase [Actinomyces bowdenii]